MRITIDIRDEDAELIREFLDYTRTLDTTFNSHGPLDMKRLARMLLEDVALAVRRPGSWEGSNMWQVLTSHGYGR
jgi:hypothetical protein